MAGFGVLEVTGIVVVMMGRVVVITGAIVVVTGRVVVTTGADVVAIGLVVVMVGSVVVCVAPPSDKSPGLEGGEVNTPTKNKTTDNITTMAFLTFFS